jgi:hypothetical protein
MCLLTPRKRTLALENDRTALGRLLPTPNDQVQSEAAGLPDFANVE